MADYSDKYTDEQLNRLQRRLIREYAKASKDLKEKARQYFEGWDEVKDGKVIHHKSLEERYIEQYEAYQNGVYTKTEFEQWVLAQIGRGERWNALADDMVKRLYKANSDSASIINDYVKDIYEVNYNWSAYLIESAYQKDEEYRDIAFNLMDEATIKNLVKNEEIALPDLHVNKSVDYSYNRKKLQNALLQGVLQGESIGKIANRFQEVAYINRSSAIRNARTAVTAAQNGGRQDTYEKAHDMGITIQKEWLATEDGRTRDSHRMLDGVRVEYDEKFPNGLLFPAQHTGRPEEIYNCRCTMIAILPDINDEDRTGHTKESYLEWKKMKEFVSEEMNYFKSVELSEKDTIDVQRNKMQVFARKSVYTNNSIYVSSESSVSRKQMQFLDTSITKSFKKVGIPKSKAPRICIVTATEMQRNAIASYSALENMIYVVDSCLDRKTIVSRQSSGSCEKNPLATFVHEVIHSKDAIEYSSTHGGITDIKKYNEDIRKKHKKSLDKLEKRGYNIFGISKYASTMYFDGKYEETYTEYRVKKLLGK